MHLIGRLKKNKSVFVRQKSPCNHLSTHTPSCEWTRALSSRKMHLITETYKISARVCKAVGPLQSVVDSYELCEWT